MSGLFGSAAASASSANTVGDLKNDVAVNDLPTDSISNIAFNLNPADQKDFLAVASWDKKVRIYEVDSNSGQAAGRHAYDHNGPVFGVHFFKDGQRIVSAGADNQAKLCDLNSPGNIQVVAQHDKPIRSIRCVEINGQSVLVTGSWDKKIRFWDLRQSTPVVEKEAPERVYSMDARDNMLVIATAERYVNVMDMRNPSADYYKKHQSPLKWQTRVVSCFADASGYAIGSIEGRCAIQYVEEKDANSNFSFKCHRDSAVNNVTNVYAVNDISFHPVHGTFSTAGSDGTFHFWDKDAKHRLKGYPNVGGPITATTFNKNGNIFAYAVSYDWSKGYQANNPQQPIKLMLHPVQPDECKPRPNAKKR
ncbi:WD40-repeat-containing domain protein [Coniella lustricola]|uniref:WD40-repeat-containing domain protein n=1 Tax=Coniella lustricola TaxID=2025994 RepID=A0A2T3A601_9PEZI|nr:WD40-repeat-containing domain protein [Coniella lustricola]